MFSETNHIFIWAQMVGLIGILVGAILWQSKSPRTILFINNFYYFIWAYHFYLLNAPVAVAMNIISLVKNVFVIKMKEIHLKLVIGIYLIFAVGLSIFLWENIYSVFPVLGCSAFNLALLYRDNRAIIARGLLLGEIFWLPYSIQSGSIMSASCGFVIICAVLYGMARHEKWRIGNCYNTFFPSIFRSLFINPRTTGTALDPSST